VDLNATSRILTRDVVTRNIYSRDSRTLLAAYLEAISLYMDRVQQQVFPAEDTGTDGLTMVKAISVLKVALSSTFPPLLKYYLDVSLPLFDTIHDIDKTYQDLITCWARYVALVTGRGEDRTTVGILWITLLPLLTLPTLVPHQ
jgi:hypothetical protein